MLGIKKRLSFYKGDAHSIVLNSLKLYYVVMSECIIPTGTQFTSFHSLKKEDVDDPVRISSFKV